VLLAAALAFSNVAGKQYGNGMQIRTCQSANPLIGVIAARKSKNVGAGSHPLSKLLRKCA
jgi:hypothetical protein